MKALSAQWSTVKKVKGDLKDQTTATVRQRTEEEAPWGAADRDGASITSPTVGFQQHDGNIIEAGVDGEDLSPMTAVHGGDGGGSGEPSRRSSASAVIEERSSSYTIYTGRGTTPPPLVFREDTADGSSVRKESAVVTRRLVLDLDQVSEEGGDSPL